MQQIASADNSDRKRFVSEVLRHFSILSFFVSKLYLWVNN